jgi:hypothetical protein
MTLKAYNKTTGEEVKVGDMVINFRGETAILTQLNRGEGQGFSGKVTTSAGRTVYDKVWNLRVVNES